MRLTLIYAKTKYIIYLLLTNHADVTLLCASHPFCKRLFALALNEILQLKLFQLCCKPPLFLWLLNIITSFQPYLWPMIIRDNANQGER